jgi:hypothetical protein
LRAIALNYDTQTPSTSQSWLDSPLGLLLSADRTSQNQNSNRLMLLMNDNIVAINFN